MKLDKKIILVGKAASGKSYFSKFLVRKGYIPSISYSTRKPRTHPMSENDGEDYHFVSEESFMEMVIEEKFFEHKIYDGNAYGTLMNDWEVSEVFIYAPLGIREMSRSDLDDCIVVYFDIPLDYRINRMEKRLNPLEIPRRLDADNADFKNFNEYNVRVVNPEFDCEKLLKVVLMSMAVC